MKPFTGSSYPIKSHLPISDENNAQEAIKFKKHSKRVRVHGHNGSRPHLRQHSVSLASKSFSSIPFLLIVNYFSWIIVFYLCPYSERKKRKKKKLKLRKLDNVHINTTPSSWSLLWFSNQDSNTTETSHKMMNKLENEKSSKDVQNTPGIQSVNIQTYLLIIIHTLLYVCMYVSLFTCRNLTVQK